MAAENKIIFDFNDDLLESQENIKIANFIAHEACQKYYTEIKKDWIPLSFIEFYFEEYKRYCFIAPNYITPFFNRYTNKDPEIIMENYYNTQYCLIKKKANKKEGIYYQLIFNDYMNVKLYSEDFLGSLAPDLYEEIKKVSVHMENSDEVISLKEKYTYFMMKKVIEDFDDTKINIFKKPSKIKKAPPERVEEPKPQKLVGKRSEVIKEKGKVNKLFFPKLTLPTSYPVLQNKSRINSDHRPKAFIHSDKQIKLINKHKFNGVEYTEGFIQKRRAAKKSTKKKFDFDF